MLFAEKDDKAIAAAALADWRKKVLSGQAGDVQQVAKVCWNRSSISPYSRSFLSLSVSLLMFYFCLRQDLHGFLNVPHACGTAIQAFASEFSQKESPSNDEQFAGTPSR